MPVAKLNDVVHSGVSPLTAKAILGDVDLGPLFTGQTATGTTQATAFPISAATTVFGTAPASSGAVLPTLSAGDEVWVTNYGANTLTVYPPVGGAINNGSANAGVSIAANGTTAFKCVSSNGLNYASK